jgi:maleate isomerase
MFSSCYRGVVGVVKPTRSAGSVEEMIRLLPDGVGVIPLFLNVREQTEGEFRAAFDQTEEKVRELATEFQVDLIHPEGAPLFMLQGWNGEQRILKGWEDEYGLPLFTSGSSCVEALRALGVARMVGLTYIKGDINQAFGRYFEEAGFDVLAMECVPEDEFETARQLTSAHVYYYAKQLLRRNPGAEGIYLLGSGWRCTDIIEEMEQDLGVPVVHPVPARVWAVQNRLHINQPVAGYGRLLEALP